MEISSFDHVVPEIHKIRPPWFLILVKSVVKMKQWVMKFMKSALVFSPEVGKVRHELVHNLHKVRREFWCSPPTMH